jgi:hypothetical protein
MAGPPTADASIACFDQALLQSRSVRAIRLLDRPIITPDLHPSIGRNIQGPSSIQVPDLDRATARRLP